MAPRDLLAAVDEMDDLLFEARSVPFTGTVLLDRDKVNELRARVRAATPRNRRDLVALAERLDAVFAEADALAGRIRVRREDVYAVLDELRDVLRPEPSEATRILFELGDLLHGAKTAPLTGKLRLDPARVQEILARLRGAAPAEDAEVSRRLDALDELVRTAKPVAFTDDVGVDWEEAYRLVDELIPLVDRP